MKLRSASKIPAEEIIEEGASQIQIRWLLSRPEGAPNFALRLFDIAPGGHTPLHQHPWEHEVYILEGETEIMTKAGPIIAKPGDAILITPNELHQFRNRINSQVRFLCMVPLKAE